MYTRGYTEAEIRGMAARAGLRILEVARDTVTSEAYGTEHALTALLER